MKFMKLMCLILFIEIFNRCIMFFFNSYINEGNNIKC